MRGDFSRNSHRPNQHYSRVLMQQGRVILDADWNEQVDLQLWALRQMARDLIGPHGGPGKAGFEIARALSDGGKLKVLVNPGRYYVDGIMVDLDCRTPVTTDASTPSGESEVLLVYLEVWERHVTWIEENMEFQQRSMREVALGGPDTASRSEIRWRVNAVRRDAPPPPPPRKPRSEPTKWISDALSELAPDKGRLAASLSTADIGPADPCRDTAQPRYRGLENRLYRVEIHEAESNDRGPTFKWSRENGAIVYPINLAEGQILQGGELAVEVAGLGRDDRYRLRSGNIVELVTATLDEAGEAGPLLEVIEIGDDARTVKLRRIAEDESEADQPDLTQERWALLRRWDQPLKPKKPDGRDASTDRGAIVIDGGSFMLEDGIEVRFQRPGEDPNKPYGFRVGDYWLIPARTIPGDIEWPRDENGRSEEEVPHGVERHFAPLATIDGNMAVRDLRRSFGPLATPV